MGKKSQKDFEPKHFGKILLRWRGRPCTHTHTIIYYIQDLYDQFVRISVSISEVWHKVITQVFNNFEYIIHVFTFRCMGIMDSLSGEETNLKGFFFSFGEEGGIKKSFFFLKDCYLNLVNFNRYIVRSQIIIFSKLTCAF